jgi:hypothetical protein
MIFGKHNISRIKLVCQNGDINLTLVYYCQIGDKFYNVIIVHVLKNKKMIFMIVLNYFIFKSPSKLNVFLKKIQNK